MSDGQKQAATLAIILTVAVLACVGVVWGTVLIFGEVTELANPAAPTFAPQDGVLITVVLPNSPAFAANLQPGHVLLQLNDETISSPELLTLMLNNMPAGTTFTLLVRDEAGALRQTTAVRAAEPPYLGVEIVALPLETPQPTLDETSPTPTVSIDTKLPVVSGIVPDSPAATVDIQIGDIMTAVDGAAILNGAELFSQMANKVPGEEISLTLRRGAETLQRTAELVPHPEDAQRGFLGIEFQP